MTTREIALLVAEAVEEYVATVLAQHGLHVAEDDAVRRARVALVAVVQVAMTASDDASDRVRALVAYNAARET